MPATCQLVTAQWILALWRPAPPIGAARRKRRSSVPLNFQDWVRAQEVAHRNATSVPSQYKPNTVELVKTEADPSRRRSGRHLLTPMGREAANTGGTRMVIATNEIERNCGPWPRRRVAHSAGPRPRAAFRSRRSDARSLFAGWPQDTPQDTPPHPATARAASPCAAAPARRSRAHARRAASAAVRRTPQCEP
jgi:hypothetical protein